MMPVGTWEADFTDVAPGTYNLIETETFQGGRVNSSSQEITVALGGP
jgi:hypothetical protein